MRRRRENKKHIRLIIGLSFCLLLIMTIGYAAFSTNLTLTAKGNIKEVNAAWQLKKNLVNSEDGLYTDSYENGRYIYRGQNPNNYIVFNNEKWRIISIEKDDTIKIIKESSIGDMSFDTIANRDSTTNTFCVRSAQYGCNAWAATSNLNGNPNEIVVYFPNGGKTGSTASYSGTVIKDSSLNTYLNTEYYNSLVDSSKIIKGTFYIGTPGSEYDSETMSINIDQAKAYSWTGNIGLMSILEYMNAIINPACNS